VTGRLVPSQVGGACRYVFATEPPADADALQVRGYNKRSGHEGFLMRVDSCQVEITLSPVGPQPCLFVEVTVHGWRVLATGRLSTANRGTASFYLDEFPCVWAPAGQPAPTWVTQFAERAVRQAIDELRGALDEVDAAAPNAVGSGAA